MTGSRLGLALVFAFGSLAFSCSSDSSSAGNSTGGSSSGGSAGATGGPCGSLTLSAGCMLSGVNECDDYYGSPATDVQSSCQVASGTFLANGCDTTNNLGHCVADAGTKCEVIWSYPPAIVADEQQSCLTLWQGTWTSK